GGGGGGGCWGEACARGGRGVSGGFREQAAARDLRPESDATGNLVAWWDPPGAIVPDLPNVGEQEVGEKRLGLSGRGVLTGSHLDSVLDGGAYDGPLGVVSALAAVGELRGRGFGPGRAGGAAVLVERR